MAAFTLTTNPDTFVGLAGQTDTYFFTASTLQGTDVITGGATGAFMDIMELTAFGTITAPQFAGVTNIEQLVLPSAGDNVALSDGLVAGSSLADNQFDVAGNSGIDVVDGSLVSSKNLVIAGFGGNDTLTGGSGNDIIDGGSGVDTMAGGAGDDLYFVDNEADVVVENPGGGTDAIYSTVNYTLPANVEALYLVAGAATAINAAGNSQQNFIYGNEFNNALSGGGGDDVLIGGAGNDILDGGPGDDVMVGGTGDDTYYVDSEADTIVENPNEGTDTVFATINYTLPENFEILFLVAGAAGAINGAGNSEQNFIYGNELDNALSGGAGGDVLVGGAGNDILDGGTGADTMAGGTGDDTYFVDTQADTVMENPGEGTDTVKATCDYTLTANVENLILLGSSNLNGAGNILANVITGNSGDNNLLGMGGADQIFGGGGNDKIWIPDSAFASIDGGTGFNWLVLQTNGQDLNLTANSSKISNIDVISLSSSSAAFLELTYTDIAAINNAAGPTHSLYVIGEADDTVTVGDHWTLIAVGTTNVNLPFHTFNEWQSNTDPTDFLFIDGNISPAISASVNSPPVVFLDGDPSAPNPPNGLDHAASYTTGDTAGVAISDVDATVDDPDTTDTPGISSHIVELDATITDPHSGADEYLILTAAGHTILTANPGLSLSGENTDHLQITGSAVDTVYQDLLREVRYVNTDIGPGLDTADRHITVSVSDGIDSSNIPTATISLTSGNTPPTAFDDTESTDEDTPLSTSVPAATDIDGTIDHYVLDGTVATGLLTFNPDGTYTFDPNGQFEALNVGGHDTVSFSYHAVDNDGASSGVQTVTISVTGVNDPAQIEGTDTGQVTEDGPNLLANGGFETGTYYGWNLSGDLSFTFITNSLALVNSGNFAAQTAGFVPPGSPSILEQTVATTLGEHYLIDFWLAMSSGTPNAFQVTWNGDVLVSGTNIPAIPNYIHYEFDVVGAVGSSTLHFDFANNPAFFFLDDVSVETPGIPTATGDLNDTDVDNPNDAWTVVAVPTASDHNYGTFTIDATGHWSYTLDNDNPTVEALNVGDQTTDTFTVQTVDGTQHVVTVTIHGDNDAAVISGNISGTVIEAGGQNNSDPGQPTTPGQLTDADVDNTPNTFLADSGSGDFGYGTWSIDSTGLWSYTLDNGNPAVEALNVGDHLTDTFTVHTQDGTPQLVTITIDGTNDAAVISGDISGEVTEAGGVANSDLGTPTTGGHLEANDVDNTSDLWQADSGEGDNHYGSFGIDTAGNWTYDLDNSNPAVEALNVGDTLFDTFTAHTDDGTPQLVTVTIHGANDAAQISGDISGEVTERSLGPDLVQNGSFETGSFSGWTPDGREFIASAAHLGANAAEFPWVGSDGILYQDIATTVGHTYHVDFWLENFGGAPNDFSVTFDGQTVFAIANAGTFGYTEFSGDIVVTDAVSRLELAGRQDPGAYFADDFSVREVQGTPTATGDLNDTDVDNTTDHWQAAAGAGDNNYGSFTLDTAGHWTYTVDDSNPTVDALNDGGQLTDTFTALTDDGTAQIVTVTIDGANDPAVVSGDIDGKVTEAGGQNNSDPGSATAIGTLADTDVDNPSDTFLAELGTSDQGYGTFSVGAGGLWSYTLDNTNPAVEALNVGDQLLDTFTAHTQDGTPQLVTITIDGANDAATFSGDDTGDVTEDGTIPGNPDAAGTLVVSDVDSSPDVVGNTPAAYGTFAIDTGGNWTYHLDNSNPAVDALNDASTPLLDTITVTTADGTTHDIVITIHGANDAPVANDDSYSVDGNAGLLNVTDPGQGVLANDTDVDGPNPLTASLVDDAQHGTVILNPDGTFLYLLTDAGYTGPDTFTYVANDGIDDSATATVTLDVTAANNPPDAPPLLDLDTSDGNYIADNSQPAGFHTAYTSGAADIPVTGTVAAFDDNDAIAQITIHLQAGGATLDGSDTLSLPPLDVFFLLGLGYTFGLDTSDPTDWVYTVTAPVGSPAPAAFVEQILQDITYSDPLTDFSFQAADRTLTFVLTDTGGNDTTGQLSLPVTHVDISANVVDTSDLGSFTGGDHGDTVVAGDVPATITDGAGDDTITGSAFADTINSGGGSDTINGGGGADTIDAGSGDDTIFEQNSEAAGDTIDGGPGNDTLQFDGGTDAVSVEAGVVGASGFVGDTAFGSASFTNIESLAITTHDGGDTIQLDQDLTTVGVQLVSIDAGAGDDTIDVSALTGGTTFIDPGPGDDTVILGGASDTIHFAGSFGNDNISGFTTGDDVLEFDSAGDVNYQVSIADLGSNQFDLIASNTGGQVGEVHVTTTGGTLTNADLHIV